MFCNNGDTIHHGGCNTEMSKLDEFHCGKLERFTQVYLHTADRHETLICDLSFVTDEGRSFGPFATDDGDWDNTQNKVYRAGAKVMKLSSGTSVYLASVRGM